MPGNSQRRGAVRKPTSKGPPGRLRRSAPQGPRGQRAHAQGGRPHRAPGGQDAARAAKRDTASGAAAGARRAVRPDAAARPRRRAAPARSSPGATPSSRRCAPSVPVTTMYVAGRIDSDDRVREALKIATARGIPILETPRGELDRLTDGAVHQGLALQVPPYDYAHPSDLVDPETPGHPAHRRARRHHRPAQPRRDHPLGRGLRWSRRRRARAPLGRDDRQRLEDVRRCRGPDPGGPGQQPDPCAGGVPQGRASSSSASTWTATCELPDLELASEPLVVVVGSEGKGLSRLVARDLRPDRLDPDVLGGGVAQRRDRRGRHAVRGGPPPRALTRPARARAAPLRPEPGDPCRVRAALAVREPARRRTTCRGPPRRPALTTARHREAARRAVRGWSTTSPRSASPCAATDPSPAADSQGARAGRDGPGEVSLAERRDRIAGRRSTGTAEPVAALDHAAPASGAEVCPVRCQDREADRGGGRGRSWNGARPGAARSARLPGPAGAVHRSSPVRP